MATKKITCLVPANYIIRGASGTEYRFMENNKTLDVLEEDVAGLLAKTVHRGCCGTAPYDKHIFVLVEEEIPVISEPDSLRLSETLSPKKRAKKPNGIAAIGNKTNNSLGGN